MTTQLHFRRNRRRAFSLLEIMIVLVIITVLAGAGVWTYTSLIDDAKDQRAADDIKQIETYLLAYERKNHFRPPTQEQGLKALVEKPTTDPQPQSWRQYMEEVPIDPWGNEYQYRVPPQRSGKKYDIFSLGEDGEESEDDIGNWN